MITFITHVRVMPVNAAAFETLMDYVRAKVRENEPYVLYYEFAKSADEADCYVVIEVYRNEAAHSAHMQTEWVKSSIARSNQLVENARYDIKQYVSPGTEPVRRRPSMDQSSAAG